MGHLRIMQEDPAASPSPVKFSTLFSFIFPGNQKYHGLMFLFLISYFCCVLGTKGFVLICLVGLFNSKMLPKHTVDWLKTSPILGICFIA